jgi:hypothetical protein
MVFWWYRKVHKTPTPKISVYTLYRIVSNFINRFIKSLLKLNESGFKNLTRLFVRLRFVSYIILEKNEELKQLYKDKITLLEDKIAYLQKQG